jgi:hypothetical protein
MPIPPIEQNVEFLKNHLFEISKLKEIMKERKIQKLVSSCQRFRVQETYQKELPIIIAKIP